LNLHKDNPRFCLANSRINPGEANSPVMRQPLSDHIPLTMRGLSLQEIGRDATLPVHWLPGGGHCPVVRVAAIALSSGQYRPDRPSCTHAPGIASFHTPEIVRAAGAKVVNAATIRRGKERVRLPLVASMNRSERRAATRKPKGWSGDPPILTIGGKPVALVKDLQVKVA